MSPLFPDAFPINALQAGNWAQRRETFADKNSWNIPKAGYLSPSAPGRKIPQGDAISQLAVVWCPAACREKPRICSGAALRANTCCRMGIPGRRTLDTALQKTILSTLWQNVLFICGGPAKRSPTITSPQAAVLTHSGLGAFQIPGSTTDAESPFSCCPSESTPKSADKTAHPDYSTTEAYHGPGEERVPAGSTPDTA